MTVHVRAGTQTNCGGFARISARVEWSRGDGVTLVNAYRGKMRGPLLRSVFAGARNVVDEASYLEGLRFTLIDAVVHPVDATERRFFEAGQKAMRAALLELVEDYRLTGSVTGAHTTVRAKA